jgi:hypothetical protein
VTLRGGVIADLREFGLQPRFEGGDSRGCGRSKSPRGGDIAARRAGGSPFCTALHREHASPRDGVRASRRALREQCNIGYSELTRSLDIG